MELLDAIGLADDILQQCVAVRTSAAYDSSGKEKKGAWSFIEGISDTRYAFASVLRQRFVEEIFRGRLGEVGGEVVSRRVFESVRVDEEVEVGGVGRVVATVLDEGSGERYEVRCRYLVGCDGSRTTVRGKAGIESVGDRSEDKWVRIDGVLKSTTMPKPRAYGAIESKVYGNVLWIPLDHGATRLGYNFNEERRKIYGEDVVMTEEVFVKEAKECVKPFEIEYERVDWASVYSVGQRVAKQFKKDCVFLAGDACHTHSSGAGQGMNAGVHDAVNLGWKMALVLTGRAKPELLETYDSERRPNAERLIKYDEDISILVSGRLPKSWKGDPEESPNEVLNQVLQEAKGFNTGLTLGYGDSMAVWKEKKRTNGHTNGHMENAEVLIPAPAVPGYRAPDVKLTSPALWEEVSLHKLISNKAKFHLLVFVGTSPDSRLSLKNLKTQIEDRHTPEMPLKNGASTNGHEADADTTVTRYEQVNFITILPSVVANAWHELGFDPLGKVYFDTNQRAGHRFGTDEGNGTVFMIRPDGWIGAKMSLVSKDIAEDVTGYLGGMLIGY